MTRRPGLRAAALLAVGLLAVTGAVRPARAVSGRLAPVQESYQPGESATLVGYTGGPTLRGVPAGPFYAYLRPAAEAGDLRVPDGDVPLGPLVLEPTRHTGFLALRVSITFDVPADLEPGEYVVWYCDDPCTRALIGDLSPSPLAIGVEPGGAVTRQWAFDEPEIANLAPDALIVGADFEATADDVRAGRVAPPPEPPATAAPAAPPTVAAPAATTAPVPPAPVATAPAAEEMDWRPAIALSLVAAATTWVVLARRERASAPELASGRPPASGPRTGAAAARR